MKGAYKIFPFWNIDGSLSSYGTVHLGDHRCWNLHEGDAPVINGSDEAGQIPYYAAAQSGDASGAVKPGPDQFGTQLLGLKHIFGSFPGIHYVQAGHESRALQGLHYALCIKRGDAAVRDNRNLAVQTGAVGKLSGTVQCSVFHVDVVGTFTESKRNGRHEASMGYSGGNLKRKVRMRRRRRILLLMRSCPGCQRRKSFQDNFQMLRA